MTLSSQSVIEKEECPGMVVMVWAVSGRSQDSREERDKTYV